MNNNPCNKNFGSEFPTEFAVNSVPFSRNFVID